MQIKTKGVCHMAEIKDPENTILMELKDGTVIIELLPDIAPGHCDRMKELARSGAYDNVCFHRVIDGFMAQSGDVKHGNMEQDFDLRMAGTGGSDLPNLKAEFSGIPMIVGHWVRRALQIRTVRTASFSSTLTTTIS